MDIKDLRKLLYKPHKYIPLRKPWCFRRKTHVQYKKNKIRVVPVVFGPEQYEVKLIYTNSVLIVYKNRTVFSYGRHFYSTVFDEKYMTESDYFAYTLVHDLPPFSEIVQIREIMKKNKNVIYHVYI